jgi:hypothetical protein
VSATSVVRTFGAVVAEVVRLVLVEPVRDGRLRSDRWPAGLAAIVALAATGFVAAAALVLAAPAVRRHSDLAVGVGGALVYPRWTTPLFLVLVVLTLALLHAGSLHLSPWLRVAALVVVVLAVLGSALDTVEDNKASNAVSFAGAGLLVLLTVVRWRAQFRWWEFVTSFLVLGTTLGVAARLVAHRVQALGFDTAPQSLVLTMQLVSNLAIPFTFVAGLAFAQLAVLLTHRVGGVVEERVGPTALVAVLAAVVAAADVVLVVLHLRRPTESGSSHVVELASAGLLLAVAVGLALVVVLRRTRAERRGLDRLEDAVSAVALPIGLAITTTLIVALVLTRVDTQINRFTGGEELHLDDAVDLMFATGTVAWTRVATAIALLTWAVWQRRRRPLPAVLAVTIGCVVLASMLGSATRHVIDLPWTSEALTDVAAVVWVVVLVVLAATRRLDRRRLVAVGIALGLSLAYSVRSTFDAPFVALFGLGAGAALFLGVVWATLTDADDANADSHRYPRPARVLFFLANALLAMTTLAFVSIADTEGLGIDISAFATLGDDYLGTGLLLAAYAVLAWEVVTAAPSRRC